MILEEILKDSKTENLLKRLEESKNNNKDSILLIEEINLRIKNGTFKFNSSNKKYIYIYMFICNKLELTSVLNTLISNDEFIKLLDKTDIDGSMLPSLTSNCNKPRKVLVSKSKKIQKALLSEEGILNAKDFISDLTKEEIQIFREDIAIDNFLITNGLSFNTLKTNTKNQLLNEIKSLSIYNIETINEFIENFQDLTFLIKNRDFLDLYLEKINDNYNIINRLFYYIDEETLDYILSRYNNDYVLLNLVKDSNEKTRKILLKDEHIESLIKKCKNDNIISKVPNSYLRDLLVKTKNLFSSQSLYFIDKLSKKDIVYILDNNIYYYDLLIKKLLEDKEINMDIFIKNLPSKYYLDLNKNYLEKFSNNILIKLLKVDNKSYKKEILKNKSICTRIVNNMSSSDVDEFFNIGEFTIEDKIKLINQTDKYNVRNIIYILKDIPLRYRKDLYNINELRKKLITSDEYEIDEYMISYFLNNPSEIKESTPAKIIIILNNIDQSIVENIFDNLEMLTKIFSDKKYYKDIILLLKTNNNLISIINKKKYISLIDNDFIALANEMLSSEEKRKLFTNEFMKLIFKDEDIYQIYTKLLNKNSNLLNTLEINFLNNKTKNIKLSFLEKVTKYPNIQKDLLIIDKYVSVLPELVNSIFYSESLLPFEECIGECIKLIKESAIRLNRKRIGNIPRIISVIGDNTFSKNNLYSLLEYLLYFIPRYYKKDNLVNRPIYLDTPSTFNEIVSYSKNTEEYLTNLMSKEVINIKEYFIAKHFKLSLEETELMLNTYSLDRIDSNIYKDEYEYLSNLNKIYNTDTSSLALMDSKYKIYSMHESFIIESNIKKMYGKIFNYEIRSKTYSNNPYIKNLYGREIKIFDCPNDFLFLINNTDLKEEYELTNSYFKSWHNTLDKKDKGINTSLISNDHFILDKDFVFGFNGLLDEGLLKMSNYNICSNISDKPKEKFMTPRELIDNSRDYKNTLIISRYAVRPNFNNSNLPYLEPDFILADKSKLADNTYLEKISRASQEFKTKRNKEGLPIIAVDINKLANNELKKINQLLNKYNKTHDMTLLPSLLTKILNNYSAYILYDKDVASKFDINNLISIIIERINVSNSLSELNYIEETIINEFNKYKGISKDIICNIDLKKIKEVISNRKITINDI